MKIWAYIKTNYILFSILLFYGIVYSLVSLVNHYNFRTYGFDLGIYNNALFDYSNFHINDNPVMHRRFDNILSDHFSLYHFVFCHFRYLMGSWTLLIFQIFFILFGSVGIYKLIHFLSGSKIFSNLAAIHFLSFWGIFSALSYDYHDNVVATMFVPWLLYYLIRRNVLKTFIFLFIILIGKENMSLWTAFIFLGMLLWYRKDSEIIKLSIIGFIISIAYFVIIIRFVMPSMANEGVGYNHFKYGAMGNDMFDVVKNMITNPVKAIKMLFYPQQSNIINSEIKFELHYMVLLAGGIAMFFRPQFLIMLIPVYIQKLYHSDFLKWGINFHYSIEFAPILTIATFVLVFQTFKNEKYRIIFSIVAILVSISSLFWSLENRKSRWYYEDSYNFMSEKHYSSSYNNDEILQALATIPEDANVCAQNQLIPRLAFRENIYTFPYFKDKSDYIVVLKKADYFYPLKKKQYDKALESLKKDELFNTFYENQSVIIFKRKHVIK